MGVLDKTRAQNMAIVLNRLKVVSVDLCNTLRNLDFENVQFGSEDMDLLISVMPTAEESKRLLEHKDNIDRLRDIEQKVMPLCLLERSTQRLALMQFATAHASTHTNLLDRCAIIRMAAEEVRWSTKLQELLILVLRIGNFINDGVEEVGEGSVRGFAIESVNTLSRSKIGAAS